MNPSLIYQALKTKLLNNGYHGVILELDDIISIGSTSTEIWGSILLFLRNLEKENPEVFELIAVESQKLEVYFDSTGMKKL